MSILIVRPSDSVTEFMRPGIPAWRQEVRSERATWQLRRLKPCSCRFRIRSANFDFIGIEQDGDLPRGGMTGWRYLVCKTSTAIAAVEASAKYQHDEAVFSHTNEGVFVRSCAQRLGKADNWLEVQPGQYVFGLPRVLLLCFMALWFRDARGRGLHNILVTLDPAHAGIAAGGGAAVEPH